MFHSANTTVVYTSLQWLLLRHHLQSGSKRWQYQHTDLFRVYNKFDWWCYWKCHILFYLSGHKTWRHKYLTMHTIICTRLASFWKHWACLWMVVLKELPHYVVVWLAFEWRLGRPTGMMNETASSIRKVWRASSGRFESWRALGWVS